MANFHNSQQTQLNHNHLTRNRLLRGYSKQSALWAATGCNVHCGRHGASWECTEAPRVSVSGNLRGLFCTVSPARREHVENDFTRTTQLRTGLPACCALYSQRLSTTRKSNASLWCFWVQLTELEQNIFFALIAWNILQLTDHKRPTTLHYDCFHICKDLMEGENKYANIC